MPGDLIKFGLFIFCPLSTTVSLEVMTELTNRIQRNYSKILIKAWISPPCAFRVAGFLFLWKGHVSM